MFLLVWLAACGRQPAPGTPTPAAEAATATRPAVEGEAEATEPAGDGEETAAAGDASGQEQATRTPAPGSQGQAESGDAEPNNTREEAARIEPNVEYQAELEEDGASDFFVVEQEPGAAYSLVVTPTASLVGAAQVDITDANGNFVGGTQLGEEGGRIDRRTSFETGGELLVQVSGGSGDYTFQLLMTPPDDAGSGGDAPATFEQAVVVETATDLEGDLGDLDTSDYYSFTVPMGSVITATLSGLTVEEPFRITIYDAVQNFVVESEEVEEGQSASVGQILHSELGGTYVAQVRGAGRYGLGIEATPQNDAGSGGDAPDNAEDAPEIEVGTELQGLLGDRDTDDAYTFEVEPGAQLQVTLDLLEGESARATLYDENGNYVAETDTLAAGETGTIAQTRDSGDPTTFALVVNGAGVYSFQVSVGTQDDAGSGGDAGDADDEAAPIETNSAYQGFLGDADTEDRYRVQLAAGASVDIEVTAAEENEGEIELTLYNEVGNYQGESDSLPAGESGAVTRLLNDEEAGDYILVFSGEGAYEFTVNEAIQEDGGAQGDAGGEAEAAVPVAADEELEGRLGDNDTDDYYRLDDVPAGAAVAIEVALEDDPEDGSLELTLYGEDEQYLAESESLTAGQSTTLEYDVTEEDAGDILLIFSGAGTYRFQITVTSP